MFLSWAMRADSTASRAAISAASSDLVASDLQRPRALLLGDARGLDLFAVLDGALLQHPIARQLQHVRVLLVGDALGGNRLLARDTRGLHGAAGGDLGLLQRAVALDLEVAHVLLRGDALGVDGQLLGDARLGGRLARGDIGLLDGPGAIDLAALRVLVLGDAHLGQDALLGDPGLLDLLARGDLGLLDGALALDLVLPHLPLGSDAGLADGLLVGDPGLLDLLARSDLGALGLGVAQRALARQLGALDGAADLDVALLIEAGGLALALDVEGLLLGLEVARADADHRVLLDVVPQLAAVLDLADQLGQAFGVEPVRGIEELQVGLVEVGQRHGLELEAVLRQRLGGGGLDALQVDAALLVHLDHGHLGGDRAQRRDELAGEQRVQALLLHGAAAERRGGERHRLARRRDADVEVGVDVDPHAVLGDERVVLGAGHAHLQHVHVDGRDVVDDRQHEGAAVDDHPLAHEAGADERHLLGGSPVEPVDEVDDDRDGDDRHDQPQDDGPDQLCSHLRILHSRGPLPGPRTSLPQPRCRPISLNFRVCSVSATSVGRRSIDDAP